jgi:hypothetical protein
MKAMDDLLGKGGLSPGRQARGLAVTGLAVAALEVILHGASPRDTR